MENAPFTIRPARAEDAPAMKQCVEAAYEIYIPRIGKPPGPMLDDYDEIIRRHQAHVVEERGAVRGVLVLVRLDGGILLDNMAVHPSQQGKGLGARLVEAAEDMARNQGYEYLELYTHVAMTENIDLYLRRGYVETERKNVRGYDRIYMRKRL